MPPQAPAFGESIIERLEEQLAEAAADRHTDIIDSVAGERHLEIQYNYDPDSDSGIQFQTASSSVDENLETGRGPRFVNRSTPITKMDEPTLAAFVYNKAVDEFGEQAVGSAYAGNGVDANGQDGVMLLLFQRTRERVTNDITDGNHGPIAAFNRHTETWPHELRAKFADYEYQQGREEWPNYNDELEQFADAEGVLGMEYTQTELDAFYGDNPYDNDDLSNTEARVVMAVRHYDADESEVDFSDVSHTANFLWWIKETEGDVEAATRAHHYGTGVPTDIISQAAPPDEWAGAPLDPDNITTANAYTQSESLYRIVHHSEGETWVDKDGPVEAYNLSDPSSRFYCPSLDDGENTRLARPDEVNSGSWDERVLVYDGETVVTVERYGRLVEQTHNRLAHLSDETLDTFDAVMTGTNIRDVDMVQLTPQERPNATMEAQEGLLTGLMESPGSAPAMFGDGPLFVTIESQFDGTHESLYFDRTNPDLARDAKEALEGASDAAVEAAI